MCLGFLFGKETNRHQLFQVVTIIFIGTSIFVFYQSFLCSFIAVPLLVGFRVAFTTYDFTFRPNYVTTLAIRLRQVKARGRGKGGNPRIRVRTSRVDYVKRVNAHEAGQANFYCQDHTQQQQQQPQQRVGNKRGEKTTRN